jgi:glyoxylase-like metal-dependent hydrolase (beta-lactamase superfamily II)
MSGSFNAYHFLKNPQGPGTVMKIIPLSEGSFTIDNSKLFIPFDQEKDQLQKRTTGSLLVEIQPFAVISDKDIILLDTGLGFQKENQLQIHFNLMASGIQPAQVTKVLISHLHKDHAGGICITDNLTGIKTPAFPNASYYIQKKEFEYALEKGFPSYITNEFGCLERSPKVIFLDGDGVIDGYIRYEMTGAHCPYHQVFWIEEGGETIFFGGDVAPQLQQMKNRYVAKYDFDGKKCMELRRQWWEEGRSRGWDFLFYHDINTPRYRG